MKLPEYDNRPGPGMPLYHDSSDRGAWDDFKFPALIIGCIVLLGLSIWGFFYGIVDLFRTLFH